MEHNNSLKRTFSTQNQSNGGEITVETTQNTQLSEIEILDQNWQKVVEGVSNQLPDILYGFGYGSAVIPQQGYQYTQNDQNDQNGLEEAPKAPEMPLVDLIFVVEDLKQWHIDNLAENTQHYSGLPLYWGASFINFCSKNIFPITFYPAITLENGIKVKYGTITKSDFLADLSTWELMTVAGRLHKPIKDLKLPPDELLDAMHQNREMAFYYALDSLKGNQSLEELDPILEKIVSLSYIGDIRFSLKAENSNKVANIVRGSHPQLTDLYAGYFNEYHSGARHHLSTPIYPELLTDARLRSINRRASSRMLLNQVLLNSVSKNVRFLFLMDFWRYWDF